MSQRLSPRALPSALLLLSATAAHAGAQGGLPPVPVPPGNPITPAKAVLGKILFWEEQLSTDNRVACGTCHLPELGGGDNRRAPHPGADGVRPSPDDTFGSPGVIHSDAANDYEPSPRFGLQAQVTDRAAPSALTGAWFPELFWDGRAGPVFMDPETGLTSLGGGGALESQAAAPVTNAVEMAHDARTWQQVTSKLAAVRPMAVATALPPDVAAALSQSPTYPDLFAAAFGDPTITAERVAFAIATYERTLVPDQSPWDRFQRGNATAMSPQQVAGMNVFNGAGRCNLCHTPGLFSDRQFRNLGLRPIAQDPGRQAVTNDLADAGRFKVPSLRNVGLRRSFMHTGQFTALRQVIGFYRGGGGPNLANKDPLLRPLQLSPQQSNDLEVFVQTALTDPRVAARQFPFDRPTLLGERLPPGGAPFRSGTPGSGGIVPVMLAAEPPHLGNADLRVGVGAGLGGAPAALAVAAGSSPPGTQIGGTDVAIDPATALWYWRTLQGPPLPGAGYATVHATIPNDPALAGLVLFAQWFVFEPALPVIAASSRGAVLRLF